MAVEKAIRTSQHFVEKEPYYEAIDDEIDVFSAAFSLPGTGSGSPVGPASYWFVENSTFRFAGRAGIDLGPLSNDSFTL